MTENVRIFGPAAERREPVLVIEVRDGYLLAPDRPGLGIALDDAGLAMHPPVSADLSRTVLREDGSVAIR